MILTDGNVTEKNTEVSNIEIVWNCELIHGWVCALL